jgi:RPA family protein
MSANGDGNGDDGDGDSGPGTREVAYRLFAAEFEDCDFQFSESDEERAPNFVITPTGGRVNRMFLVGVLTELEQVNQSMLRARVVDPTGAFVVYAGQYQPEALSFLERTEPPAFLAVTGKARTYQPEDSDVVYSSVRPESISEVDAATRDRWVVSTAEQTLDRIGVMAAAIESGHSGDALREALEAEGVDPALAQGVALAREHYGTTPGYLDALRDLSLDATRVVANELEEAGSLDLAPDEGGEADLGGLRSADTPGISPSAAGGATGAAASEADEAATSATTEAAATSADTDEPTPTTETTSGTAEGTTADTETGATSTETASETTGEPGSEPATATESGTAGTTDAVDADTRASESAGGTAEETPTAAETAEPEGASESDGGDEDDIGEFEPGEFDAEEPEEDPLGEEVREQVEEEYGTEFSTGTEVESEPDLEPEAEPEAGAEAGTGTEPEPAAEPDTGPEAGAAADAESVEEEPTTEPGAESAEDADDAAEEPADEPAGEVDLAEAVMDAMRDLDDGDGAPTDAVIDRVVDRTGASPDEVDDAVQDALMGGQCYEPEDGRLKPI